ncbi:hypothetical protein SLS58_010787 [Diplodia intermedia]|uniref:Xylanolytic transcriptional activator regulatory domain-containing protein n=1 Tax=Diplodia intermedia TaxID=856260 RepID=A0ABR3T416_9PEZI
MPGQSVFYGPTGLFSSPALAGLRKSATLGASGKPTPKPHGEVARACLHDDAFRRRLIDDFDTCANTVHRFVEMDVLDTLRTAHSVPVRFNLLYAAVVACGAFLSAHAEVKDMCSLFVDSAQAIALTSCQTQANVYVVQGLNILAWLELGRGNGTSSWMFTSMAGAMVVHQGLHVQEEPCLADQTAEPRRQERTLAFWSFFWVNRTVAAVLGRTTFLPKSQVKVPALASFGTLEAVEDACLDSLCQLWSLHDQHMEHVLSFDFPTLDTSKKEILLRDARLALNQFYGSVDARLRTATDAPPSYFYFQISYHVSLILLHRPFLNSTPSPIFSSALHAMAAAASSITDLLHRLRTAPHRVQTIPPFIIYHVLRAASVLLLLATSSTSRASTPYRRPSAWISARMKLCLEVLDESGRTWQELSERAVRTIRELAARWNVRHFTTTMKRIRESQFARPEL